MPVPLVIAGIAGASAVTGAIASSGLQGWGKAYLKRTLSRHSKEIEQWALASVFEKMGLPDLVNDDGRVDRRSFTAAVNASILSGQEFQLTDLFDSQAVKNDALKFGLLQVAQQAGLEVEHVSVQGLGDAVRAWVMDQVAEELTAEDVGELIQDAKDVYEIIQLYKRYKKAEQDGGGDEDGGRKPLINTPEAISNRERQARYRANNKRRWVPR